MASSTNFGASIVPENRPAIHLPQPVTDSPVLTPAVSRDGDESLRDAYTSNKIPAQSPFYTHPPASHELVNEKVSNLEVFEKDIESGDDAPLTPATEADEHPFSSKIALEHSSKECTMWPSKQTLKKEYKAQKSEKRKTRGCLACAPARDQWSKLSKRNKLLAKIALALFLAGIAVAIGVGISSAVKGTYYVSEGHSQTVGR